MTMQVFKQKRRSNRIGGSKLKESLGLLSIKEGNPKEKNPEEDRDLDAQQEVYRGIPAKESERNRE